MYEQLLQERNVQWIQGICDQGRTAKDKRDSNFTNTSKRDEQASFFVGTTRINVDSGRSNNSKGDEQVVLFCSDQGLP